jgi:hypothetical protein
MVATIRRSEPVRALGLAPPPGASPPPAVAAPIRPRELWVGLAAGTRAQIRQAVLHVAREVVRDARRR